MSLVLLRRRSGAAGAAQLLLLVSLLLAALVARAQQQQQTCAAEACAADAAADAADAATAVPPSSFVPLYRRAPRLADHLRLASASLPLGGRAEEPDEEDEEEAQEQQQPPRTTTTTITAAALSDEGGADGLPLFAALGDSRGRLHLVSPGTGEPILSARGTGSAAAVTAVVVAARAARSAVVCSGHADGSVRCFDVFVEYQAGENGGVPKSVDLQLLGAWSPRLEQAEREDDRDGDEQGRRQQQQQEGGAGAEGTTTLPPAAVVQMVHLRGMVGGGVGMRVSTRGGGVNGTSTAAASSSSSAAAAAAASATTDDPIRRWPPGHVAWADASGTLYLMNCRSARPWARFAVPRDPPSLSQAAADAGDAPPPPPPTVLALRAHLTSKRQGVQLVALTPRSAAVAYLKRVAGRVLARRACAGLGKGEALSAAAFDVGRPFRAFALSTGGGGGSSGSSSSSSSSSPSPFSGLQLLAMIVPADRRTTFCRVTHRVPLPAAALLGGGSEGEVGGAAAALSSGWRLAAARERLAAFAPDGRMALFNLTAVARGEAGSVLAAGSVAPLLRRELTRGDPAATAAAATAVGSLLDAYDDGDDQGQGVRRRRQQRKQGSSWWRAGSVSSSSGRDDRGRKTPQPPASVFAAGSTGRAFLWLSSSPSTPPSPQLLTLWEAVAPATVPLAGSPQAPADRRGASGGGGWSSSRGGGTSSERGGPFSAVLDVLGALQPMGLFGMIGFAIWRYQRAQQLSYDPRHNSARGRAAMMMAASARRRAVAGAGGGGGWPGSSGGLLDPGGRGAMFSDPSGPGRPLAPGAAYALAAGAGAFAPIREDGEGGEDEDESDEEDDDPEERRREAAYAAATRVARQAAAEDHQARSGNGDGLLARDPLESEAEAYTRARAEAAAAARAAGGGRGGGVDEGDFEARLARLDAAGLGAPPGLGGGGGRGRRSGGGRGAGGLLGGGSDWGSAGGAAGAAAAAVAPQPPGAFPEGE
jgi:hypothetical protein